MTIIHAVIQTIAPLLNSLRENVFSTTYFAGFLKNMSNIREAITPQLLYIAVYGSFHTCAVRIPSGKRWNWVCEGLRRVKMPPKKQNTARAAPEDSESLWGRWRRLPVCRGYSWSELVDARSIVARYIREARVEERPGGGRNNVRVDEEMRNCLSEVVDENCLLTLWQINRELRRRLPNKPFIHDRTVARTLDGMLFRVKVARPLPAERNRPDVLERRTAYANWFMNRGVVQQSVFVDECGYNIWTSRSQGRARQGEWAYRQVCGQRAKCDAISPINGLVFHSAIIGGMNAERCSEFLAQLSKVEPRP